jgi:hypothetical protein
MDVKNLRITVPKTEKLAGVIPSSVWAQQPFKYTAQIFEPSSERFDKKPVPPQVQSKSLIDFAEDTKAPIVYCIAGTPDDSRARYFAAFLTQLHMQQHKFARPVWTPVFAAGSQPMLPPDPTLLTIYNLAANSTAYKLDRVRDLLTQYDHIPRLLVVSGEDPISFMRTRLYHSVQAIQFFPAIELRQSNKIITV